MSKKTFHYVIRVPKKESAFCYFQFEANEGLCFYSTLPESLGQHYRDIDIQGAIEFEPQVLDLIKYMQKSFTIDFIDL